MGEERHVHFYQGSMDTISDSIYNENITIELRSNKWLNFTKSKYPYSIEMCANKLVRSGSLTIEQNLVPHEIWTITVKGDSLYGIFEENNGWAGTNDHYYFAGKK